MKQSISSIRGVPNLIYIGSEGGNGVTLRSRLSDHFESAGWQTAFRRKVFEHVLGVSQSNKTDAEYIEKLKQARSHITEEILSHFAFKCLGIESFRDFEVWLIQKYVRTAIEGDLSTLESQLLENPLVPFSEFSKHSSNVPDEVGVYVIFRIETSAEILPHRTGLRTTTAHVKSVHTNPI